MSTAQANTGYAADSATVCVDAVVVGGGIGGLTAARALSQQGRSVLVLEATDVAGGPLRAGRFAALDVPFDIGVESFATRGVAVSELVDELGLAAVPPASAPAWGYSAGRTFPLPADCLLGIPARPLAADVRRAVGLIGAARAQIDRWLPRSVGDPTSLGSLVRTRMGRGVANRLVNLIAGGIHSASIDHLSPEIVAPGLVEAFQREGSLARAVAAVKTQGPNRAAGSTTTSAAKPATPPSPRPMVHGVEGGIFRIVERLVEDLDAAAGGPGQSVRCEQRVIAIERGSHNSEAAYWTVTTDAGLVVEAATLVAATSEVAPLLTEFVGTEAPTTTPGAPIALVALLLDAPELATAPRGTGMLISPDGRQRVMAKAMTHLTAKWPWLDAAIAQAGRPGLQIVRLSYGSLDGEPIQPDLAMATADTQHLLGVDLNGRVLDHLVQRWDGSLPPPTPAYRKALSDYLAHVEQVGSLHVVGGWIAGTGLAAIIKHAREAVCPQ